MPAIPAQFAALAGSPLVGFTAHSSIAEALEPGERLTVFTAMPPLTRVAFMYDAKLYWPPSVTSAPG